MTRFHGALALILAVMALAAPLAGSALAAGGPDSCGKGEVWDADKGKCVKKPRAGSHAG